MSNNSKNSSGKTTQKSVCREVYTRLKTILAAKHEVKDGMLILDELISKLDSDGVFCVLKHIASDVDIKNLILAGKMRNVVRKIAKAYKKIPSAAKMRIAERLLAKVSVKNLSELTLIIPEILTDIAGVKSEKNHEVLANLIINAWLVENPREFVENILNTVLCRDRRYIRSFIIELIRPRIAKIEANRLVMHEYTLSELFMRLFRRSKNEVIKIFESLSRAQKCRLLYYCPEVVNPIIEAYMSKNRDLKEIFKLLLCIQRIQQMVRDQGGHGHVVSRLASKSRFVDAFVDWFEKETVRGEIINPLLLLAELFYQGIDILKLDIFKSKLKKVVEERVDKFVSGISVLYEEYIKRRTRAWLTRKDELLFERGFLASMLKSLKLRVILNRGLYDANLEMLLRVISDLSKFVVKQELESLEITKRAISILNKIDVYEAIRKLCKCTTSKVAEHLIFSSKIIEKIFDKAKEEGIVNVIDKIITITGELQHRVDILKLLLLNNKTIDRLAEYALKIFLKICQRVQADSRSLAESLVKQFFATNSGWLIKQKIGEICEFLKMLEEHRILISAKVEDIFIDSIKQIFKRIGKEEIAQMLPYLDNWIVIRSLSNEDLFLKLYAYYPCRAIEILRRMSSDFAVKMIVKIFPNKNLFDKSRICRFDVIIEVLRRFCRPRVFTWKYVGERIREHLQEINFEEISAFLREIFSQYRSHIARGYYKDEMVALIDIVGDILREKMKNATLSQIAALIDLTRPLERVILEYSWNSLKEKIISGEEPLLDVLLAHKNLNTFLQAVKIILGLRINRGKAKAIFERELCGKNTIRKILEKGTSPIIEKILLFAIQLLDDNCLKGELIENIREGYIARAILEGRHSLAVSRILLDILNSDKEVEEKLRTTLTQVLVDKFYKDPALIFEVILSKSSREWTIGEKLRKWGLDQMNPRRKDLKEIVARMALSLKLEELLGIASLQKIATLISAIKRFTDEYNNVLQRWEPVLKRIIKEKPLEKYLRPLLIIFPSTKIELLAQPIREYLLNSSWDQIVGLLKTIQSTDFSIRRYERRIAYRAYWEWKSSMRRLYAELEKNKKVLLEKVFSDLKFQRDFIRYILAITKEQGSDLASKIIAYLIRWVILNTSEKLRKEVLRITHTLLNNVEFVSGLKSIKNEDGIREIIKAYVTVSTYRTQGNKEIKDISRRLREIVIERIVELNINTILEMIKCIYSAGRVFVQDDKIRQIIVDKINNLEPMEKEKVTNKIKHSWSLGKLRELLNQIKRA